MGKSYGERIRSMRLRDGLTIDELAKKMAFSSGYISELENGRKPTLKVAQRVAKVFGTDFQEELEKAELD